MERQIAIGCIASAEYLQQIQSIWDTRYIESDSARRICLWAWEYFEETNKAPGNTIYDILLEKTSTLKISEKDAKDVEEILNSLSKESFKDVNLEYLLTQTKKYFKSRRLTILSDTITTLITRGQVDEAEKQACNYKPEVNASETDLDLSNDITLDRVERAFNITNEPVISYPKQLGQFWNDQLIKGGFVSILASDKKGKSYFLLDMAMRACRNGKRVCLFQAGDMSEASQLRRICVYLAQRSDQEKYCDVQWEPVRDCVLNQTNVCQNKERECGFGIFDGIDEKELRYEITLEKLIETYKNPDNSNYVTCHNCKAYETNHLGAVWIKQIDAVNPLTTEEAQKEISDFFITHKRHFKLSSHANGTLSVRQIEATLAGWEKQEGFVPDLIVIDYADLLVPETKEFRHGQDEIWRGLRRLSQQNGNPLVVTATQADAKAYERNKLTASNFSEDKRKHSHITAEYALNQDVKGREKKLGIIRIGEIMLREGDFEVGNEVTVLMNLRRGRPFISSFF